MGVGSDEAIDLLMRIFCKPGEDQIMTTPPTYGMYNVSANINDVQIVQVPLTEDFDLRIPEVSAFGDDTCMHYVYCAVLHAHCMQIAGGTSTRNRTPLVI